MVRAAVVGAVTPRYSLSDVTGATLVRFETIDGLRRNIDENGEEARAISHGGVNFRALPPQAQGDFLEPYLYRLLRLDRARFVFDLPSSMRGTGATRTGAGGQMGGSREGFVFERGQDGKANGSPIGKIIFMTSDRKFRELDAHDRRDFERTT